MPNFRQMVSELKKHEHQLMAQLEGIRAAVAALEFGSGGGVPAPGVRQRSAGEGAPRPRRKLSARARKAISDAQKKRWAAKRAADKNVKK